MTVPLAFLTYESADAPMILNVSREGQCERIELSDAQLHRWQILIAEYLMIKAQRREHS